MHKILNFFRFWILWLTSASLNFFILAVSRQFYMTDDFESDYFTEVASRIDAWVVMLLGFGLIVFTLLINTFLKDPEKIISRFGFVSGLQLFILGVLRFASIPFVTHFKSEFLVTGGYIGASIGLVILGLVLFGLVLWKSPERPKEMLKTLFKVLDIKYLRS